MSPSHAIKIMEERHQYLMERVKVEEKDTKRHFLIAEAAALEIGIEAIAEDIAEYRELRAARYAVLELIGRSSC